VTREQMDEIMRHFNVVAEHIESQVRIVAEGHTMLGEQIQGVRDDVRANTGRIEKVQIEVVALDGRLGGVENRLGGVENRLSGVEDRMGGLEDKLASFRAEVAADFGETRSMIKLSYAELDARVSRLERSFLEVKTRLDKLEGRQTS
jgi:chromosome segregation ATPase